MTDPYTQGFIHGLFLFIIFDFIMELIGVNQYLRSLGEKAAEKLWSFCTKN